MADCATLSTVYRKRELLCDIVADMYSIYQPVLSNFATEVSSLTSASPTDGYHLIAAASEGQLTLTEVTPKLENCDVVVDDDEDVSESVVNSHHSIVRNLSETIDNIVS